MKRNCEICKKEHDGSYGSGRFCGWDCACKSSKQKRQSKKQSICLSCQKMFIQRTGENKKFCNLNCSLKTPNFSQFNYNRKGKSYDQIYGSNKSHKIINAIVQSCKVARGKRSEQRQLEINAKRSKVAKLAGNGGYRIGGGRGKGSWYYSECAGRIYCDSSYELAYSKWLDKNKINWKRNKTRFPYTFEGKERMYIPDFYLVDTNEYIEIKGYQTEKDRAKWKYFPDKLTVLFKQDLIKLGVEF